MKYKLIVGGFVCAVLFSACGSSGSDGGGGDSTSTLSTTMPGDLAIASPTSILSASPSISKMRGGPLGSDFESKKTALDALIDATGACSLAMGSPVSAYADCYGPNVKYAGWPDTSAGEESGNLPNGDLGIWAETEDGVEACAAAKMNSLVDGVAGTLDYMIGMLGVMVCSGKKASLALPAAGSSIDLLSAISSNAALTGISLTSAAVARESADVDGHAAYVSTIEAGMEIAGESRPVFIRLKHIPANDDNSEYRGKLSMYVKYDIENDAGGQGCKESIFEGVDQGGVLATVTLYQKAGTTLTYEMNNAVFCGADANPFLDENGTDDGKYNLHMNNYAVATTNEDGWGDNWNYGLFEVDSTTGLGAVVYAWQASRGDGVSRVFNMTVGANADGTASGRAYAGHGTTVTDSASLGVIKGFICNYAGPNNPDRGQALESMQKVQYQALERTASATQFAATTSNILYAPTNDCTASAGTGPTYFATAGPADPTPLSGITGSNDRTASSGAVEPNFINRTSMIFTAPAAPSDVD